MAINTEIFRLACSTIQETLQKGMERKYRFLTEGDLCCWMFADLAYALADRSQLDFIGLHSQPRFFVSPRERSKGRYPDLCLLDKDRYFFSADGGAQAKGYVITGSSIQIEVKLRRLHEPSQGLEDWLRDIHKLETMRSNWYTRGHGQGPREEFFPLFVLFSHLELSGWEAKVLHECLALTGIGMIACDPKGFHNFQISASGPLNAV